MSVSNGLPKFTGFIRRLVEDGRMTAENMQQAMLSAKKAQQDIVPYLIENHKLSPQMIAETISLEFGEPVFDLSVYDSVQILRDLVEDKLITKHRVLPIY
ncbi:MAG: type IV-A pilus assembly ATPase PilB, partial [Acinetobacter sp.]